MLQEPGPNKGRQGNDEHDNERVDDLLSSKTLFPIFSSMSPPFAGERYKPREQKESDCADHRDFISGRVHER